MVWLHRIFVTKLNDAVMRLELEEAEVCHLKEVISGLNIDLDSRDTPVVMAHEAKVAAETALQQLTDDLATLGARLQFDVSSACPLTPEATSLAENVASILMEREEKVRSAWDRMSKMSAEMAAINDIERLEKEVQTTKALYVVSTRHICKPLLSLSFCHYWVVVSSNYADNSLTCDVYMMCELFQSR
ncbi:unnamed protein product [Mesocestoides corti]|uniref:Uncharacterized protein n=2 Tax=Mesocestoides corti TaxID=53468 RepID=A0A0R3UDF2_MESCO|nr:unnamed protein product [Mesocestoides corti]